MPKQILGLFPGQGSQVVGMGKSFFENSELAKKIFSSADEVLGYSISKLCFEGPIEELTLTKNAQPAILTVSYIAYLLAEKEIAVAAGHSLGEYSALVASKSLEFADAVLLVHKRGKYMQEAVAPGTGGMLAVLGLTVEEIEEEIEELIKGIKAGNGEAEASTTNSNFASSNSNNTCIIEIANINCPGQTVLAGNNLGIESFQALAKEKKIKAIKLPVSAPFHCSLMKPAQEKLARDLEKINFKNLAFPVYSNVTAKKISSASEARQLLETQVCAPVLWTNSMNNILQDFAVDEAMEFGAGEVLSNLLKRITPDVPRVGFSEMRVEA